MNKIAGLTVTALIFTATAIACTALAAWATRGTL